MPATHASKEMWEKMFQELATFQKKRGHCLVPQGTPLGIWVHNQRNQYKAFGGSLYVQGDRVARLERLGFVWSAKEAAWSARLGELAQYKKQHGDCNVPQQYSANRALGSWVRNQRDQSRRGDLSAERSGRLTDVGFVWVPPRGRLPAGGAEGVRAPSRAARHQEAVAQTRGRSAQKHTRGRRTTTGKRVTDLGAKTEHEKTAKRRARAVVAEAPATGARRGAGDGTRLGGPPPADTSSTASNVRTPTTAKSGDRAKRATKRERRRTSDPCEHGGGPDRKVLKARLAEANARIAALRARLATEAEDAAALRRGIARTVAAIADLRRDAAARTAPTREGAGSRQAREAAASEDGADADFTPFVATRW